jgi:hypothetical protein
MMAGMTEKTGELPAKAGVKSLSRKLEKSRHGFDEHPAKSNTPEACGKEARERTDKV